MWSGIFLATLRRFVKQGTLVFTMPDGKISRFGSDETLMVHIRLHDKNRIRKILINPELGIGEAYMDGALTIEQGTLHDFLALIIRNMRAGNLPGWQKQIMATRARLSRYGRRNPIARSRHNVEHHYDISVELYDLFLSEDRLYTCAYYENPDMSLCEAQVAKIEHIAKKLLLEPGLRVLDIGCGWGYMACYLADKYGVHVTGVSLSKSQLEAANSLARDMGCEALVDFQYKDYREIDDSYDRIYSVGMLEHVGQQQYQTFFSKVHQVLKSDGVALIHFIARTRPPGMLSPWFNKYIFPGGYTPAFSEMTSAIENSGLMPADLELWRGHYEHTLRAWLEKFETNADKIHDMYDERFVRMWRYYLVASEISFTEMKQIVCQFQLTNDIYRVPGTRDYLNQARNKKGRGKPRP